MGLHQRRSYTDAIHIWGWFERVRQWYESDPEPDEGADWVFQPCRDAEKALGNCEKHEAHIVQRHLDACEETFAGYLKHRDQESWADFLHAADLLRDKLEWLAEKLESNRDDKSSAKRGAPLFKKDPPFGNRVSIDVRNAVNTFMAEWHPGLNKEEWCDNYRQRMKRPSWNLRKILYDYLTFPDS